MPKEPQRLSRTEAQDKLQEFIPDILNLELSLKELRFLFHYINNDMRAGDAYQSTQSKQIEKNSASSLGCQMLGKPKVQSALRLYMESIIGASRATLEHKILQQLMARAFYSPFSILEEDGALRPIDTIPEELHQCIVSIESIAHPKYLDRWTKVKLADRDKARAELIKYINMMKQGSEQGEQITPEQENKLKLIQDRVKERTGPVIIGQKKR